jgi:DNA-binding CsgD family transcriptional regulator
MNKLNRPKISEREKEIVVLACQGLTDKEICRVLGLSLTTVRTYWGRMREKLGATNRAQIIALVAGRAETSEPDCLVDRLFGEAQAARWAYIPATGRVLLDSSASRLFGVDGLAEGCSARELLAALPADDRCALERLFRSSSGIDMTGVLHRVIAPTHGSVNVKTVLVGSTEVSPSILALLFSSTVVAGVPMWVEDRVAML